MRETCFLIKSKKANTTENRLKNYSIAEDYICKEKRVGRNKEKICDMNISITK